MIRIKQMVAFSVVIGILAISVCALAASVPNPIPDTGQTQSYTDTFGEDSDYTINPPSYTKLDAQGYALPDEASSWSMVKDNITGLIWEVKTDDGSIHDKDDSYTWYDAQSVFIASLNAEQFGGFSDWRLPTVKELSFIVNSGTYNPAINTTYFSNTMSFYYWSFTTHAGGYTDSAWCVAFGDGYVGTAYKLYMGCYVRAVRGGQSGSLDNLVINSDGTVTDTSTGLMWQQETAGPMTWEEAISYCEGLSLGGYNDWRLPNRNELQSLVDYTHYWPAIDTAAFPNTVFSDDWASTSYASGTGYDWCVFFGNGGVYDSDKSFSVYVHAVRGVPQSTATVIHVPADYSTIQAAIDAALPGDTVLVADGIYTGYGNKNLDFKGKAITVKSKNGPENCVIDCEGSGRGFYFHGGEASDSVLNGIIVKNGASWKLSDDDWPYGGGICCMSSSPTINNCIITGNNAENAESGGGIYCYNSSPAINNCTINGNSVGMMGGGICCHWYSSPTISNCIISGNFSINNVGGGICCMSSSPIITNCTISRNSANSIDGGGGGGGIYCMYSSPIITECTISDNSTIEGGGIYCDGSSPIITNCTISSNSAEAGSGIFSSYSSPSIKNCTINGNYVGCCGGGIYCKNSSLSNITNCIFWDDSHQEIYTDEGSIPIVTYSNIQGGYTGEGNINADPLFVDVGARDYHFLPGSPCIDSGTNQGAPDHDKDGKTRPMDGDHNGTYICDMGAYEFEGPTLIELVQFTAVPQNNQITLTWTTLSEIDNAGFNLWRSDTNDEKYTRINFMIIEAKGGATQEAEYAYSDDTAKVGVKYYYKLEDIDTRGNSTFHGPVSAMIPKSKTTVDYYPPYWLDMYSKPVWPDVYSLGYSWWPYYPYP